VLFIAGFGVYNMKAKKTLIFILIASMSWWTTSLPWKIADFSGSPLPDPDSWEMHLCYYAGEI